MNWLLDLINLGDAAPSIPYKVPHGLRPVQEKKGQGEPIIFSFVFCIMSPALIFCYLISLLTVRSVMRLGHHVQTALLES
jgi:hypothetical protein